jgi:hypothetical protein
MSGIPMAAHAKSTPEMTAAMKALYVLAEDQARSYMPADTKESTVRQAAISVLLQLVQAHAMMQIGRDELEADDLFIAMGSSIATLVVSMPPPLRQPILDRISAAIGRSSALIDPGPRPPGPLS